jgi:hypothetical protein
MSIILLIGAFLNDKFTPNSYTSHNHRLLQLKCGEKPSDAIIFTKFSSAYRIFGMKFHQQKIRTGFVETYMTVENGQLLTGGRGSISKHDWRVGKEPGRVEVWRTRASEIRAECVVLFGGNFEATTAARPSCFANDVTVHKAHALIIERGGANAAFFAGTREI